MDKIVTGSSTEDQSQCPFGPDVQRYWDKRYEYFSLFDEGIQIDREGLYSVTPEKIAIEIAKRIRGDKVLDAFCGVGGNAIGFARTGKKVLAFDIDHQRIEMAKSNAEIYKVDHMISFMKNDAMKLMKYCVCDSIYLAPAWGGPDYYKKENFSLSDFSPDGNEILKTAFEKGVPVGLMIPKNFDQEELVSLGRSYEIEKAIVDDMHLFSTVYFE